MSLVNHKGGVGEIGLLMTNHAVSQKGTIGGVMKGIVNHNLDDGAPKSRDVIQFKCDDRTLAKELGLYSYAIRSLACSSPEGIFQIPDELRAAYFWLKKCYDRIGISCSGEVVYDDDFSLASLPELKNAPLSVFFFGGYADGVRPNQKRLDGVQTLNSKVDTLNIAQKLGVKIPFTLNFSSINEVCSSLCPSIGVIKIANSVSGLGFLRYFGLDDLEKKLSLVPQGVDFQIQEYLPGADFLSFQWWIDQWGIPWPMTGTCNFIEGDANHSGNWGGQLIPHQTLENFTRPMVNKASQLGVRDWLSFDVALYQGEFYLIECNPRYTGAAYPFVALMKLLGHQKAQEIFWASKSYKSSLSGIDQLDLGGLEYDPQKKQGWVPINPGPLSVGDKRIALMYVGNPEKYQEAEFKLQCLLA